MNDLTYILIVIVFAVCSLAAAQKHRLLLSLLLFLVALIAFAGMLFN